LIADWREWPIAAKAFALIVVSMLSLVVGGYILARIERQRANPDGVPTSTLAPLQVPSATESVLTRARVENTLVTPPVPTAPTEPKVTSDYRPLFDGVDLSGWQGEPGESRWGVDSSEKILVGNGAINDRKNRSRWLFTEQAFADFRLRFELRMGPNTDSGLSVRSPPFPNPSHGRVLIRLANDPSNTFATGTIPGLCLDAVHADAVPIIAAPLKPSGEWNLVEIEFRGPQLEIKINDQLVQDVRVEARAGLPRPRGGMLHTSGRIGVLCQNGHVEFRKIEIEKLPTR
jgi:hypothetical protein